MKKIIGNPTKTNNELINLIKKTKINNFYLKNQKDFRDRILQEIELQDHVLDIGMAMRDRFKKINSKVLETLDVNDFGAYRMGDYEVPLQNGMILTVEPGIYISDRIPVPEGQPKIDEKWKGIGIRIEDDILVTDTNPEVLSIAALKEISDLEF